MDWALPSCEKSAKLKQWRCHPEQRWDQVLDGADNVKKSNTNRDALSAHFQRFSCWQCISQ